ncbi:MAG TPA: RNA-binding S4 domain-containing protein [Pyrinomonadaceae bacterium]|nr:RNA-binding S4 domain-containing protein [Pyrinomonadaceae bacterium]
MRLDVFLKVSRLITRRTLAQEFCDAGLIEINGAVAKSGKEVKVGDEITIRRRDRKLTVRVNSIPDSKQVSKQAAGDLYTVIADISVESA